MKHLFVIVDTETCTTTFAGGGSTAVDLQLIVGYTPIDDNAYLN